MYIHKLINKPYSSNCFIISFDASNKCIVLDPASIDISELIEYLESNNLNINTVILTHEHYDHCMAVNALYYYKPFQLLATEETIKGIANSRRNLSFYHDEIATFEIHLPAKKIFDFEEIAFENKKIICFETPGHSTGSMCILIDNYLFTGDTILNNSKTPLKLPGSNKLDYEKSIEKIYKIIRPGFVIYPGHGCSFSIT